jgi:hypothetical protein
MKKEIMNKKAQGLESGSIVTWVIAILILVIAAYLIYNYYNAGNLPGSGRVNVGTIVQNCQVSCSSNGIYDYCRQKNIVFDDSGKKNPKNNQPYNCKQLETENVGLDVCRDINCDVQYYKCSDLAQSNCAGVTGCNVAFVTPGEVKSYQDQVGPLPLKYKEVKILTVTDPVDKATGNVCLKLVNN